MKNTTFEVQPAYRTHPLSFIDAPNVFTAWINGKCLIYKNIHFPARYNKAVWLNSLYGEKASSFKEANMEKYDDARYAIPNFDEDYDEEQQREIVLMLISKKKKCDDIESNSDPERCDYEAELEDSNYKAYKLSLRRKSQFKHNLSGTA